MKTRLLVSVRDCVEALAALDAGTDLIDVKEPRRGALGAVDREVLQQIVHAVAGRATVSAALGELLEMASDVATEQGRGVLGALPRGVSLAKFGLAGCRAVADWPARLHAAVTALPKHAAGVAVIYADQDAANSPAAADVIRQGQRAGCRAVLVDTHDKRAGGLLDLWTLDECRRVVEQIRAARMLAVLAGSLTAGAIERILPLAPDYVGVRGAACRGARDGSLDADRVRALVALVRGQSEHPGERPDAQLDERPVEA